MIEVESVFKMKFDIVEDENYVVNSCEYVKEYVEV